MSFVETTSNGSGHSSNQKRKLLLSVAIDQMIREALSMQFFTVAVTMLYVQQLRILFTTYTLGEV